MSLPVTTPFLSVVEDAVFTARVVVVTARVFFRRMVEVFAVTADAVIVEALACIIVSLDVVCRCTNSIVRASV